MFNKIELLAHRRAYSAHVLRAHLQGFAPLTLGQFLTLQLFALPLFVR
jgi:hypothetical protein